MATVTTYTASSVTQNTATLNGIIDDAAEALTCGFVWNGNVVNVGYKQNQPFSANITGLDAGTTYWYYARAWDGVQWITGSTIYFTTDEEEEEPPPPPPISITTSAASSIRRTSATLNGSIANCTAPMQCRFLLNSAPYSVGYMYNTSFSYNMTGLAAGTTYAFKAQYWNGSTWVSGTELSFTTRSVMTQSVGGAFGMTGNESTTSQYHIPVAGVLGGAGDVSAVSHYHIKVAGAFGAEGVLTSRLKAQHQNVTGEFGMAGSVASRSSSSAATILGVFGMTGALTAEVSHASTASRTVRGTLGMAGRVTGLYHLKITETLTGGVNLTGVLRMARVIQTDTIMLLSDLLDELGTMLNELNQADSQPFEYTPNQLVSFLNRAQDQVLSLLPLDYFTSLYVLDEDVALDSDGKFSTSSLTRDIYSTPQGIIGMQVNDEYWAHLISFKEYRDHDRAGLTRTTDSPIYYVRGSYFYFDPGDSSDTVNVHYVRPPVKMVMNTTGDTDDDTNCELPLELKEVLLNLAASIAYRVGKDETRAKKCDENVRDIIDSIKERMRTTDSTADGLRYPIGTDPFTGSTTITETNFYNGNW